MLSMLMEYCMLSVGVRLRVRTLLAGDRRFRCGIAVRRETDRTVARRPRPV